MAAVDLVPLAMIVFAVEAARHARQRHHHGYVLAAYYFHKALVGWAGGAL